MADRDRFGGSERDYGPSGGPRHWQEPGVGRPSRVLQDTPIQSGRRPGREMPGPPMWREPRIPLPSPLWPGSRREPRIPLPSPLWPGSERYAPTPTYGAPPNIGIDRAGGYGTLNDLRQLSPENNFRDYMNRQRIPHSGAIDMMSDYYNDQLGWADQLQSEIGGAGTVTPVGLVGDERVTERNLWSQANKIVRAEVGDAAADANNQSLVRQQWEKLKQKFWSDKARLGGSGSTIGQKIRNVGKLAGRFGKGLPVLGALGFAQDWWDIMSGGGDGEIAPEFATQQYDPENRLALRRGGIASLIRRL